MDRRRRKQAMTRQEDYEEVNSVAWEVITMTEQEEDIIRRMHKLVGDRWHLIAGRVTPRLCVSSAARAKLDFKLVRVSWYQSDLVESDLVAMAEGPNATDPAQVLAQQVGGPSINPRPLNTRTRLDQLEDKMLALSGIIDQVTTLEERLDGFSDDQAHVGERLVTLEGVVEGNMATLLDQSSSQSQQRAGSSNNYNKGKNGGYQARSGGDQGHGQNRSGGASAGGASSSNSGREYHRPRNNGGASSSSRFQGRPGNLKCFLCGGNHKAYQCPQKTALNALMASHGAKPMTPLRK
ncbi:hypothetical protein GIB67_027990 [Kingdonia uniflora]|uniref:Uncharacterized protein n=1 Tax=Kingdonia uniflora TaxID=39325 RepID=A0A7J7PC68_9MAGN|nr:hypothetical protein GIB67_027990 [Kingdonia uniflora]